MNHLRTGLALALLAAAGAAQAASVTVSSGALKAVIEDSGNFFSGFAPGLEYGGREFVTIGTPSSWYGFDDGSSVRWAQYGSNPFSATTYAAGPTAATTIGSAGGWAFSQTASIVAPNKLAVHLSLTNNTGAAVDGAFWGVGFDPDQDSAIGSSNTLNRIVGSGNAAGVSASGSLSGLTVTLANDTAAGAADVAAFIRVGNCCDAVDPSGAYAAGQAVGFQNDGDDSISLAYSFGSIAAGQTVSLGYSYTFEPMLPVPEPASAVLMLGGIALLAARRLRRD